MLQSCPLVGLRYYDDSSSLDFVDYPLYWNSMISAFPQEIFRVTLPERNRSRRRSHLLKQPFSVTCTKLSIGQTSDMLPFADSNKSLVDVRGPALIPHGGFPGPGAASLAIGPVPLESHRQCLLRRIQCVQNPLEPFSLASSFNRGL